MPLLRYFTFVGGALVALLFVVSPFLTQTETVARHEAVRPVIRIASDRVGPPRVDFDTRLQTTVVPALDPGMLPQASAREAEARLAVPLATSAAPIKIEQKKTRIAKRPDRQRMAANPQGPQPLHLTW